MLLRERQELHLGCLIKRVVEPEDIIHRNIGEGTCLRVIGGPPVLPVQYST